jgi:broad specificity phosphatase PhoE
VSGSPELWLLRHGATQWAREGRHTGRTDLPLLPEGEEEARRLAPVLAGLGERAELCDDLQEWDYGDYEGITTAEIRRTVPDWTVWTHPCPGGESAAEVAVRCERLIQL